MRTEKTLAVIFLIGLVLKLFHVPGEGILAVLVLSIIAMLYFPGAFYFFSDKDINRQNLPLSIVSGLFLALIPIGILFKTMYWPGGQTYLLVGSIAAPIILAIVIFLKSRAPEELKTYYKNMVQRTSVLAVLSLVFYLIPTDTLIKIHYWDDPEMARLKTLYYTNPGNEEYKRQHDAYVLQHELSEFDSTMHLNEIKPDDDKDENAANDADHSSLIGEWGIYMSVQNGVQVQCNACPTIIFNSDQTATLITPTKLEGKLKWTVTDEKLTLIPVDKEIVEKIFPDSLYEMTFTKKEDFIELELKQIEKGYSKILRQTRQLVLK